LTPHRYYRRLAATVPKETIFEALSLAKRAVREGKVRKTRGALFVAIVKRARADRGVVGKESPVGVKHYLAEVVAAGELAYRGLHLAQGVDAIHHRP
jgi:hypothetical protein